MIRISETAQAHFRKLLAQQAEGTHIRVFVVNPGTPRAECGVSYCPPESVESTDIRYPFEGFDALVDPESDPYLEDADIDLKMEATGTQLTLRAPNAKAKKIDDNASLIERVEYVIATEINPQLAAHSGNVQVMEIAARQCRRR